MLVVFKEHLETINRHIQNTLNHIVKRIVNIIIQLFMRIFDKHFFLLDTKSFEKLCFMKYKQIDS